MNLLTSVSGEIATAIALQGDDRIVVTGHRTDVGAGRPGTFLVARYLANGLSLDGSFGGGDGQVSFAVEQEDEPDFPAAVTAPDGRIVVAGQAVHGGDADMAVARLASAVVFADAFEIGSAWFWSGAVPAP